MTEKKKRVRPPRKGFKRSAREWERSIAGHIGKITDNSTWRELADLLMMGGIGYYSSTLAPKVEGKIKNALIGAIAYRLATTEGGTPPASQIAGLSLLGALGLVGLGKGAQTPGHVEAALLGVQDAVDQARTFADRAAEIGFAQAQREAEGLPEWWPLLPSPFEVPFRRLPWETP